MTNIFKRFLKYTLTTYYAWILKWGRRSGDFGLLYYLHQPTRLKIVKMSHAFIGLHTSFLIWLGLTQLTKLSLYIGHTDDSKGPALKRLISTEKQAALKLTTFTIAITQIASYKWFWDKLLLIMPYILCTHYKVTILPSLRPAPTTVPLWYVLNKLL